ncbi:hypothetical protein EPI10_020135 [Gossypium australe]|uniref:Uncharacterized protein n=1 Tax=Gossypium australe TaxID=47621 RepID=A0A5B6WDF7_9ROSI|nr:hypothetical protein EPI10_020135 [Gossypium australe]
MKTHRLALQGRAAKRNENPYWNVRGMGKPRAVHRLKNKLRETNNNDGFPWRFTGFYGHPKERLREINWELLWQLGQDQSLPWLLWVILMRLFILLRNKVVITEGKRVWPRSDQCFLTVSSMIRDLQGVGSLGNEAGLLRPIFGRG